MNPLGPLLAASILAFGLIPRAEAQTGTTTQPGAVARGVVITDHVHAKAQVEAIDYGDRTVVLKGEDGNTVTLKVGPEAKNFDRVKVGDQVKADFYRSTAIFVRKPSDETPSASGADLVQLAAPGETPGGVVVSTREMIATVKAVDPQKREITLMGPRGESESYRVGEVVKNLDQIRTGDQVVVRYTEGLALSVEKS